jgi:hypothetical protein
VVQGQSRLANIVAISMKTMDYLDRTVAGIGGYVEYTSLFTPNFAGFVPEC